MKILATASIAGVVLFVVMAASADAEALERRRPAEIVPQIADAASVQSVAFSPDGRFFLTGGATTPELWDLATGKQLRRFGGHTFSTHAVAFSPDGRLALSGGEGFGGHRGDLFIWEVATGRELHSLRGNTDSVNTVAFSPDGRLALSGGGVEQGELKLWDVATGKEVRSFRVRSRLIVSAAFSPDGRLILSSAHLDPRLRLWDVATGKELRRFPEHTGEVTSVAFSPDGRLALSGGGKELAVGDKEQGELKLWDVATGKELRNFIGHSGKVTSVAFSPDGGFAISAATWLLPKQEAEYGGELKLWDVATGKALRTVTPHEGGVSSVALSPDGRFALTGGQSETLKLWDVATGEALRSFSGHTVSSSAVAFSHDGRFELSANYDNTLRLWDVATGKVLRSFTGHGKWLHSVAFSPDDRFLLSGGYGDNLVKLWEVETGKNLRSFTGHTDQVTSVAFSPDGRFALSGSEDKTLKLWKVATGEELLTLVGHTRDVRAVAFSPDGRFVLSGSGDGTLRLWDVATGKELRSIKGDYNFITSVAFSPDGRFAVSGGGGDSAVKLWDLATGKELHSFSEYNSEINSVVFSPDGRLVLSGASYTGLVGRSLPSYDSLKLRELATGKVLRSFTGFSNGVTSVAFSPDGRLVLASSGDGVMRLWDAKEGTEVAMMMASAEDEWVTMTRDGFFSGSHRDTDMLAIVRGLEVTTIGQVHQSLFNPDLVREALAGDPRGEVKRAAEVVNLEKVLDAGPPPVAVITSPEPGSRSAKDLVTFAARITDRGKGIGRIEWRVNGVTAGVVSAPAGRAPDYVVNQELALDPGENQIEVIAYEGRNLVASPPARAIFIHDGPADTAKPKLYILAIGINNYADHGGPEPGTGRILAFPPLTASVPDAEALSAEMEKAGAGLYAQVRVTLALNADATAAKLDETIKKIASEISPRDTFVLYAAAHGYSVGGNYYLIPQDYQGGPNLEALKTRAIGQERIQDWIANRIKAKKALILLDTCESGALTSGYSKSRTDGPASEAAVGRLHEATGRPVLTAASGGKSAYEGYKGHGVFTYALMEALHNGDTNGNGKIEVTELAAHVEKRVPELFAELKANGWIVKGVAATAAREAGSDAQSAHFGSTGEDFSIVAHLP